jgi:hypothetical protein
LTPGWRWPLAAATATTGALAVVAVFLSPAQQRDDWRGLATALARAATEEDLIVLDQGWTAHALRYYYRGLAPVTGIPLDVDPFQLQFPPPPPLPATEWPARLAALTSTRRHVWVVRVLPVAFPTEAAQADWFASQGFRPGVRLQRGEIIVIRFDRY